MPSLPIVVTMVGLVAVRVSRWIGIALIVAVAVVQALQLHPLRDSFASRLPAGMDAAPIGPSWVSGAGLAVAVLAGIVLVVVLASGRAADPDRAGADPVAPAERRPESALGGRP